MYSIASIEIALTELVNDSESGQQRLTVGTYRQAIGF
jgi:hypothetical protein